MFDMYNTTGYDLYQPFDNIDEWVIDCKNGQAFYGNLKEVIKYMVKNLYFNLDEIEDSLNMLFNNLDSEHNAIHFGSLRTGIFTFKKEIHYDKRAS